MSQSEAQHRAEARRAKILARGGAGLAKLASTARGDEASVLYDNPIPSRTPPSRPNAVVEDPAAAYQANLERTMAALGSSVGTSGLERDDGPGDPIKAFEEMMRTMRSEYDASIPKKEALSVDPTEDPPTPELPHASLPAIRDSSSPSGFPPAPGTGGDMSSLFPPEMLQMLQSATPPSGPATPSTSAKPLAARLIPIIHVLAIVALYLLTIIIWEPSVWASGGGKSLADRGTRWASLRGGHGVRSDVLTSGWASLPVFWTFVTLEILLYSTETLLTPRSPPRLPALVSQFLPLVPPHLSRPLLRVFKVAGVAGRVAGDACLLVWLFGMGVVLKGRGEVVL